MIENLRYLVAEGELATAQPSESSGIPPWIATACLSLLLGGIGWFFAWGGFGDRGPMSMIGVGEERVRVENVSMREALEGLRRARKLVERREFSESLTVLDGLAGETKQLFREDCLELEALALCGLSQHARGRQRIDALIELRGSSGALSEMRERCAPGG